MRERMDPLGQLPLIATEKVWRVVYGRKIQSQFVVTTMHLLFFLKSTKKVYCMQGAWHAPNTFPTINHSQALPPHHLREVFIYLPPGDVLRCSLGSSPGNLYQNPEESFESQSKTLYFKGAWQECLEVQCSFYGLKGADFYQIGDEVIMTCNYSI